VLLSDICSVFGLYWICDEHGCDVVSAGMTLSNIFLYDGEVVVCVHKCDDKVEGAAVDGGGDETVVSMHFVAENGNDDVADGDVVNGGDDTWNKGGKMGGDGVGWFIVIVHDDAGDCGGSDKTSFCTMLAKCLSGEIAFFNFSIFKFKNSISFSFSTIFFCSLHFPKI